MAVLRETNEIIIAFIIVVIIIIVVIVMGEKQSQLSWSLTINMLKILNL